MSYKYLLYKKQLIQLIQDDIESIKKRSIYMRALKSYQRIATKGKKAKKIISEFFKT